MSRNDAVDVDDEHQNAPRLCGEIGCGGDGLDAGDGLRRVIGTVEPRERHAPRRSVDRDDEVLGAEIPHGAPVAVDGGDVEAEQVHAAAERRLLQRERHDRRDCYRTHR